MEFWFIQRMGICRVADNKMRYILSSHMQHSDKTSKAISKKSVHRNNEEGNSNSWMEREQKWHHSFGRALCAINSEMLSAAVVLILNFIMFAKSPRQFAVRSIHMEFNIYLASRVSFFLENINLVSTVTTDMCWWWAYIVCVVFSAALCC